MTNTALKINSTHKEALSVIELSELDKKILNATQKDFPICEKPFAKIAEHLGLTEQKVISRLQFLSQQKVISRFGGVNSHKKMGASTLAALKVPPARIEEVAEIVNVFKEVNHNYEREHEFNLWFVVTAVDKKSLENVLQKLTEKSECELLNLPMEKSYYIDLAFPL